MKYRTAFVWFEKRVIFETMGAHMPQIKSLSAEIIASQLTKQKKTKIVNLFVGNPVYLK